MSDDVLMFRGRIVEEWWPSLHDTAVEYLTLMVRDFRAPGDWQEIAAWPIRMGDGYCPFVVLEIFNEYRAWLYKVPPTLGWKSREVIVEQALEAFASRFRVTPT